jgi:hypothetical protein
MSTEFLDPLHSPVIIFEPCDFVPWPEICELPAQVVANSDVTKHSHHSIPPVFEQETRHSRVKLITPSRAWWKVPRAQFYWPLEIEDGPKKSNPSSEIQLIASVQEWHEMVNSFTQVSPIVWVESDTRSSPAPNGINEECFSEAKFDLTEALKHRFPKLDTQALRQIVDKASDSFRKSHAPPDDYDPFTTLHNHPASEATWTHRNPSRYSGRHTGGTACYRISEMIGKDEELNNRRALGVIYCAMCQKHKSLSTTAIHDFSTTGSSFTWVIQANDRII